MGDWKRESPLCWCERPSRKNDIFYIDVKERLEGELGAAFLGPKKLKSQVYYGKFQRQQSSAQEIPVMSNSRTTSLSLSLFVLVALICLLAAPFTFAAASSAAGCTPMAVNRITGHVDESALTALSGNIHPMARSEFDQGKVGDTLPLEHMIMLLKRNPEQEAALQTRIDQMHNQQSPLFQKWLSADDVGRCYGVADGDIAVLSSWLQKHGFTVDAVPAARTMVIFTGTAGQVAEAFHTEIHNLNVRGEKHIANMSAPRVPAALAPVIAGFRSLHDFMPKPMLHMVGAAKRDAKTGKLYPVKASEKLPLSVANTKKSKSLITYQDDPFCGDSSCEWLGPQDFYTIYNEKPLLTGTICGGPCNGAGQTIAVIEETDVCAGQSGSSPDDCAGANDLAAFRSQFGLPAPHAKYFFGIPGYCADPGVQGPFGTGEESEADIDLQWAGATAPGAQVDFLACATTATTAGVDLASVYAVDHLFSTISSFSLSYGVCELGLAEGEFGGIFQTNAFYNSLWQQAVAEGQTVNVSAGDSGDDTCERGAEAAEIGNWKRFSRNSRHPPRTMLPLVEPISATTTRTISRLRPTTTGTRTIRRPMGRRYRMFRK